MLSLFCHLSRVVSSSRDCCAYLCASFTRAAVFSSVSAPGCVLVLFRSSVISLCLSCYLFSYSVCSLYASLLLLLILLSLTASQKDSAGAGESSGAWTRNSGQGASGGPPPRKAEIVTLHAFSSGRMTITGARSAASLQQALVSILPLLLRCPGQQMQATQRGSKK